MQGSLASTVSTNATLIDRQDEATTAVKAYRTEEIRAIDLTTTVIVDVKSAKQVWVQFCVNAED